MKNSEMLIYLFHAEISFLLSFLSSLIFRGASAGCKEEDEGAEEVKRYRSNHHSNVGNRAKTRLRVTFAL